MTKMVYTSEAGVTVCVCSVLIGAFVGGHSPHIILQFNPDFMS